MVKYAVRNFITCANFVEKRLVLKKSDDNDSERKELVNHNKLFFCKRSIKSFCLLKDSSNRRKVSVIW
ncbi:hypothetical protein FKN04_11025 [Bacillus glycinifermentans]|uniref:Uncharacterized protein n=1 Tax=Bacillus glycinifermentans TaxID=1664069 RepID=A0AAJ4D253_9BACI|nr:hypothetical protein [Bacillus glycinifermentans]QAT65100.1 hypothetical protein EQZ20_09355 [Bacillus glycinifermentans]